MSIIVRIKCCRSTMNTSKTWGYDDIIDFFNIHSGVTERNEPELFDHLRGCECDPEARGRGALAGRDDSHPDPPLCCHRVEIPLLDVPLVRLETEIAIRLYGCKAILVDHAAVSAADSARLGDDLAFLTALGRQYGVPLLRIGAVACGPSAWSVGQDCPKSALPPWAADH